MAREHVVEAQSAGIAGEKRSPDLPGGLIGRSCGGYRIIRLLGEGGMGQVYLGVNELLGKKAAIKVLLPSHSVRLRAESRFLQEARAAAQIDDPNIVDILDASEFPDGRFYILMPFIEGGSLDELCERMGPLPLEVAAEILLQVCGGLDAAHRHGIVHRDIKPQNILVGPRQQRQYFSTIVDFGIAKLLDAEMAVNVHTESKAMMGTPGYMAPEQARALRDIDARVDVYAVGTVAYRILTGRTPYLDETLYGLIEKQITNAPFPTPRELRPNVPPLWEQAILAALTIDRNRRLPSVREFAELIARGIPKGDQLVRTLVPQFAGPALPPDAAPVAGVIGGNGQTIRLPSHAAPTIGSVEMPAPRARKTASFALALAVASGMGSVVTYAAMAETTGPDAAKQEVVTSAAGAAVGEPASAAMTPSPVAAMDAANHADTSTKPAVTTEKTATPSAPTAPASKPAVAPAGEETRGAPSATASAPSATAAVAVPATAAAKIIPGATAPAPAPPPEAAAAATTAAPASPAPRAPVPKPEPVQATAPPAAAEPARKQRSAEAVRPGVVVVRVKRWATVSIDRQAVGYAPVRKELPPGQHEVVIANDERQEVVRVTVTPGKTSTIERDW